LRKSKRWLSRNKTMNSHVSFMRKNKPSSSKFTILGNR
jgi:hypothetical protein